MKYLICLVLAYLIFSCKQKDQNTSDTQASELTQIMPGQELALDSASVYKTYILGRWYIPGDPDLAMEIGREQINFGEGMLISPYRFQGFRQLLLSSTDGSTDTVAIRISADTLFVKSATEKGEAPYVRRP